MGILFLLIVGSSEGKEGYIHDVIYLTVLLFSLLHFVVKSNCVKYGLCGFQIYEMLHFMWPKIVDSLKKHNSS